MSPDYTINDAFCDGFECGIEYLIRYIDEETFLYINNEEVIRLAQHLGEKKKWKTAEEWEQLLYSVGKRYGGK